MFYDLATQRPEVLPCREERRDSKERRGDPSPLLSLAVHGGSEGLLTGQQSLRKILSSLLSTNNQICILFYNAKSKAHLSARFEAILFPYPI